MRKSDEVLFPTRYRCGLVRLYTDDSVYSALIKVDKLRVSDYMSG